MVVRVNLNALMSITCHDPSLLGTPLLDCDASCINLVTSVRGGLRTSDALSGSS